MHWFNITTVCSADCLCSYQYSTITATGILAALLGTMSHVLGLIKMYFQDFVIIIRSTLATTITSKTVCMIELQMSAIVLTSLPIELTPVPKLVCTLSK